MYGVGSRNILKFIEACSFHTSVPLNGQAKMMKKVMGMNAKKKSKYCDSPILPTPHAFSKGVSEGKKPNLKRVNVLNKLFMRYITDLMISGECSSKFVGHSIEINRVQVTPDFKCVNVFWIAKGTEMDDVIDEILQKNTGSLRHELAQLKVVGMIPKIQFVKDKLYSRAVEVDRLLSQADFGLDYVLVDHCSKLKSQLELNSLQPHEIKQIQALEVDDEIYEELLPAMPQNVFGLDHAAILTRIMNTKKKSQAVHRMQDHDEIAQAINQNPVTFNSAQEERRAFQDFLNKRQVLKSKTNKLEKNYKPELEYMHEEWLKQREQFAKYDFENDGVDEDFMDLTDENLRNIIRNES